ncbi:hypothetical protein Tco_0881321 [Tanacetum coccineum]
MTILHDHPDHHVNNADLKFTDITVNGQLTLNTQYAKLQQQSIIETKKHSRNSDVDQRDKMALITIPISDATQTKSLDPHSIHQAAPDLTGEHRMRSEAELTWCYGYMVLLSSHIQSLVRREGLYSSVSRFCDRLEFRFFDVLLRWVVGGLNTNFLAIACT